MDLTKLFESLLQGNNWILLVLAFLLFKDQIFALFRPKPADPNAPVPLPAPAPGPTPEPDQRPIVDAIVKLLPTLLPVILPLIVKAVEESERKDAENK